MTVQTLAPASPSLGFRVLHYIFSLRALTWWRLALALSLVFRFVHVFIANPSNHVFSDPKRHWENAQRFWDPGYFGSIDPIMYQAFLHMIQFITREHPLGIAFFIGLLSAVMPWFWYKAMREMVPAAWAYAAAIGIALMPSQIFVYSYYLNETILLPLIGIGIWQTMVAYRTRKLLPYIIGALAWTLACYTRLTAVPLMAICIGFLLIQPQSMRLRALKLAIIGIFFAGMAVPACQHSRVHLNFCAPFGSAHMNTAYRAGNSHAVRMNVEGIGWFIFASPSMNVPIFAPLSYWKRPQHGTVRITLDPADGREGWNREIARIRKENVHKLTWLEDFLSNAAVLFFDRSWPDDNQTYFVGWLSVLNRWLWFPLTILVWKLAKRNLPLPRRPSQLTREHLLPLMAFVLLLGLLFQKSGVMEGRYRKPVEPLLICSVPLLLYLRRERTRTQRDNTVSETK